MQPDKEAARRKGKSLPGVTTVRVVRWGFYARGANKWVCIECLATTPARSEHAVCDCSWCGSPLNDGKGPTK